jgi:hypothetical protein
LCLVDLFANSDLDNIVAECSCIIRRDLEEFCIEMLA